MKISLNMYFEEDADSDWSEASDILEALQDKLGELLESDYPHLKLDKYGQGNYQDVSIVGRKLEEEE